MSNAQCTMLEAAETTSVFKERAASYGLTCLGPSPRGCFLVQDALGKWWLFSEYRKNAHYPAASGRVVVQSVMSETNRKYFVQG